MWAGDVLAVAKMKSFASIAREMSPFLEKYQTDRPMLPFLHLDMLAMVKSLLSRVTKPEVTASCGNSAIRLLAIDLKDDKVLLPTTMV